jgi:hypothetical protein
MNSFNPARRFLETSGSATNQARQKGEAFRDSYGAIFNALIEAPFLPPWLKIFVPKALYRWHLKNEGRRYLSVHERALGNRHDEGFLAIYRSLADGIGISLEEAYGVQAIEIVSAEMSFSLGCTSLAFGTRHTADGNPRLAYNHDFPESFGRLLFVQKCAPESGHASLNLTYPVIPGAIAGVNEMGLAVSLNHAYAADIAKIPAVPITLLVAECLSRCADVGEAVALVEKTPVPNGSMITLCDASGSRTVVELSCTKKSVRTAEDRDILITFNKYGNAGMAACEVPWDARTEGLTKWILKDRPIHGHNAGRMSRAPSLIDHAKRHSESDIRAILSDHDGGEGRYDTICRHDPTTMNTIASAILDPEARTMKVVFGRACGGNEMEYGL